MNEQMQENLISELDLEKYGKNFQELIELKQLEEQFSKTSTDLEEAKTKLTSIELEIKYAREEEEKRKNRIEELLHLAKEKEQSQKYKDALEYYLELLEYEPKNPRVIYHIQNVKKILRDIEDKQKEQELEAKRISKLVQDLFESGKRYFRENNYDKALDDFNHALSIGGKNSELLEFKQKTEQKLQEIEDTLNKAKKESEEKKRIINEHLINSNSSIRYQHYDQAIQYLEKALLIMPDNKEVLENLRQAELKYKEHISEQHKQKTQIDEKNKKIKELKIKSLEFQRNEDYENAIKQLENISYMESSREDVIKEIKDLQLKFLQKQKNTEEKNEKIKKHQEDLSTRLKELYSKAVSNYSINKYQESLDFFAVILSIDPNYEQTQNYITKIQEQVSQLKRQEQENVIKQQETIEKQKLFEFEQARLFKNELQELFESSLRNISEENFESAIFKLEKCFAIEPLNDVYKKELESTRKLLTEKKLKERLDKLKEDEKKEQEKKFNQKIQLLHEQALNLFSNEHYNESITMWNDIINLDISHQAAKDGIINSYNKLKILEDNRQKKLLEEKELQEKIEKMNFDAIIYLQENKIDAAILKWQEILNINPYNNNAKTGIIEAKQKIQQIETCNSLKLVIERYLETEQNRFNEFKRMYIDGFKFYTENDFKKALSVWESIKIDK